jgi:predicted AlkP superfamily phosphohydrolase/phosphomutase
MKTGPGVLFVGIDAADKDLIFDWAREGRLPNLRALLERAAWTSTSNPVGLYVGAVWPSFYTATSPARHARYCYSQIRPGSYDVVRFRPTDVQREPFWDALSRAGRRSAIVDVPKTFPSAGIDGIQLVDWGTHDPDQRFCSEPAALAAEIEARHGQSMFKCDHAERSAEGLATLRDRLVARAGQRTELVLDLLGREAWDFFAVVFSEGHCAGHQLWHVRDPTHPRHDPALARALGGDPICDVYRAIDAGLGRILAQADAETPVFVLASHGMGPHYDATFLLPEILRRIRERSFSAARLGAGTALGRLWGRTPLPVRRLLAPLHRRVRQRVGQTFPTAGVEGSAAFWDVPNNDVYGGIRINLAGREPRGTVHRGAELDRLCARLADELHGLVNLETGRPLVRRVLRTAEIYTGEHLDALPDLMVEWDRESPIRRIHSPSLGTIEGEFQGRRTGDHRNEGLLLAAGPGIRPGRIDAEVSVMDVAPTLAAHCGVALPGVDGVPIPSLVPQP